MTVTNLSTIAIASGATDSNVISIENTGTVVGLAVTDFTDATLTFKITLNINNTNGVTVYQDGSQYSIAVVANSYNVVDPSIFLGARSIQIISSVSQGADRTITIITAEI